MATTSPSSVEDILNGPPPQNISAKTIDFSQTPLKDYYSGYFAMLIDSVLSPTECSDLLNLVRSSSNNVWPPAQVTTSDGKQETDLWTRDCGRIIYDNPALASRLLDRILPHLPSDISSLDSRPLITGQGPNRRKETWQVSRLNPYLRFLRYLPDNYFREHYDGNFCDPETGDISFLTIHLYLNDEGSEATEGSQDDSSSSPVELKGGSTRFLPGDFQEEPCIDITPKTGCVLVFQQRNMWHEGAPVDQGVKYTMRTDVMYKKVGKGEEEKRKDGTIYV